MSWNNTNSEAPISSIFSKGYISKKVLTWIWCPKRVKNLTENFRFISLVSNISEVLKKCLKEQLDLQNGFRYRCSTRDL